MPLNFYDALGLTKNCNDQDILVKFLNKREEFLQQFQKYFQNYPEVVKYGTLILYNTGFKKCYSDESEANLFAKHHYDLEVIRGAFNVLSNPSLKSIYDKTGYYELLDEIMHRRYVGPSSAELHKARTLSVANHSGGCNISRAKLLTHSPILEDKHEALELFKKYADRSKVDFDHVLVLVNLGEYHCALALLKSEHEERVVTNHVICGPVKISDVKTAIKRRIEAAENQQVWNFVYCGVGLCIAYCVLGHLNTPARTITRVDRYF